MMADNGCDEKKLENAAPYNTTEIIMEGEENRTDTPAKYSMEYNYTTPIKQDSLNIMNQAMECDENNPNCRQIDCPVCLSPIKESNFGHKGGLIYTRCKHQFHKNCLAQAKLYALCCPMCRTKLTPPQVKSVPAVTRNNNEVGGISVFNNMNRYLMNEPNQNQLQEVGADDMRTMIRQAASRGRNAVQAAMQRQMAMAQA